MSSDFDGSDLLGGYQSINFDKEIKILYNLSKLEMPKVLDKKVILKKLIDNCSEECRERAIFLMSSLNQKTPFFYNKGVLTEAMKNGTWILLDEINLCQKETLDLIESVVSKKEVVLYESGSIEPIKVHSNFMIFACMNPFGDFGKNRFDSQSFNKLIFYDFSYSLKCIKSVVQSISQNQIDCIDSISEFYFDFKKAISTKEYSNNIEPLVSGRTLCRAISLIVKLKNDPSAIFKAINLLFLTQLNFVSRSNAIGLFNKHFKNYNKVDNEPENIGETNINGFILTTKTRIYLKDVELAIKAELPVLLQGDTSTGKTSLVMALANKHARRIIRINNHEHIECSDYLGNFLSGNDGIKFVEGPLIRAVRMGYWVILDELNLAPSDVLEVLNRLLDDNREIYVPEINETIVPHPNFRIFATQNLNYSGRKGMAKSFRNRFVEIFFYEKDDSEIKEILEKSFGLPNSFIKYMLGVYKALKAERTLNAFTSLRDLFKWAKRGPNSYYNLFEIGMNIIYERQRSIEDKRKVSDVFRSVFQDRCKFDSLDYLKEYNNDIIKNSLFESVNKNMINDSLFESATKNMIMTKSYIKLVDLIVKAWNNYEPVLIIGETGLGKTRICEIAARLFKINLVTVNMNLGTESSDFVGHNRLEQSEIIWKNGPLIDSMIKGDACLIDEINLAEDAVLEMMNSVLESKRIIFIPEVSKEIKANDKFRIIATMNPGGDYGKKELSPALRSRFTEIYFELEDNEFKTVFLQKMNNFNISNINFYKSQFDQLKFRSVRKIELICEQIKNLSQDNNRYDNESIVQIQSLNNKFDIWEDVLELLGYENNLSLKYIENNGKLGITPYSIKTINSCTGNLFTFHTETTKKNLRRILRGLSLNKGVLLQGEPGCGKTSIVQNLAVKIGVPVIRINLSDQTEMSDLIGSFLPIGNTIKFIQSELIDYIEKGYWIILDEINLCTQSVIEGLNSLLDHRRRIRVDDKEILCHKNTRIFGTMNPFNHSNGRKNLPKSFLDRFVVISMESYSSDDINEILRVRFGENYIYSKSLSLRANFINNEIDSSENLISYCFYENHGYIGSTKFNYSSLPNNFVLSHNQIFKTNLLLQCMIKNIPVLLNMNTGRSSLLKFVSHILGLDYFESNCHNLTDVCDLLGQYQKSEGENNIFEWKDSHLVKALQKGSLIVFNTPELVEKAIFDRLNSLFEGQNTFNIYEKGFETLYSINSRCRMVLCCDNNILLSPALLDRCFRIDISSDYSCIDLSKIFSIYDNSKFDIDSQSLTNVEASDFINKRICQTSPVIDSQSLTNVEISDLVNKRICQTSPVIDSQSLKNVETSDFVKNPQSKPNPVIDCVFQSFRNLCGVNLNFSIKNLDLDIKRYTCLNLIPEYFRVRLNISNTLLESEIGDMFRFQPKPFVPFNEDLLYFYKSIESLAINLPKNLTETVNNLILKGDTVKFIKSLDFRDIDNCKKLPNDLLSFKYNFLETLKDRRLSEVEDVFYFTKNISKVSVIKDIVFDNENFWRLIKDTDPLNLIKTEMVNEKIKSENTMLLAISESLKSIYKYGFRNKEDLELKIRRYDETVKYYTELLIKIESRLKRDYEKFISVIKSISLCEYVKNQELRMFLEDFNDVFDYYLVFLFNNRIKCQRCSYNKILNVESTKYQAFELINNGKYSKSTKFEYSKYLYNTIMNIKSNKNDLIVEAITFEEPFGSYDEFCFNEEQINDCIINLFPSKTRAKIIEVQNSSISLGADSISYFNFKIEDSNLILESLANMSIFSTPEIIINEINLIKEDNTTLLNIPFEEQATNIHLISKRLDKLDLFLQNLYKTESCMNIEKNYRYFQYFLSNNFQQAELQHFFFNSSVYEFLDKIYFAENFLKHSYSDFLYASLLLYKSFEIENINYRRLKDTKIKLFKEPKLFKSIISDYLDRFLLLPVTSILNIKFEVPICQNIHENRISMFDKIPAHSRLVESADLNPKLCECFCWIELAGNIDRNYVVSQVDKIENYKKIELTKEYVMNMFYSKKFNGKFDYYEICLGKVINTIVNNLNQGKYDESTSKTCLILILLALDYPFIPFLYFIYKFSEYFDTDTEPEEGQGIKAGEGENNIDKNTVKEEDIVDDVDFNEKDDLSDDGKDMDNHGDLHSVSNESQGEDDVNPGNNEGSKDSQELEEQGVLENSDEEDVIDAEELDVCTSEDSISNSASEAETDSSGNTVDTDTISADNDRGEEMISEEDHNNENLKRYEWEEGVLNKNQTALASDSYNRKVEGGLFEDMTALKEGEGEEFVEGEGETHKENMPYSRTVNFNQISSDCTKLINLLRIVFESNKSNKYKGDYKSGKKLNLKKIIPYIASDYRKDKIWMKRRKSDKKEYIVRIFIDNSRSMFDQSLVDVLSGIYYKLNIAFSYLNIPLELYKFGDTLTKCRVEDLDFSHERTLIDWIDDFNDGINIVLTDGVFQNIGSYKDNFLIVMIDKGNIKKMSRVAVLENKVFVESYLDSFSLKYCVIQSIEDLDGVFVEALSGIIQNMQ